jgi:hypothetical protein
MATLSFEGETHTEIVAKVKRWLASLDGEEELLTPAEAIEKSAELTKDALKIIANAAPKPVAQSEIVKGLTSMGYSITDATSKAMVDALDGMSGITGDALARRARDTAAGAVFEMNQALAKQILRSLRGRSG